MTDIERISPRAEPIAPTARVVSSTGDDEDDLVISRRKSTMFDTRIRRSLAALVVAGALILPMAACQSGQVPQPSVTVGPAAGHDVLRNYGTADRLEQQILRERRFHSPDRPERLGIQRWCSGDQAQFDAVERAAATRHCRTLRGY